MNYKLFGSSLVPQLTRLFANATADDKSCYLVKLNSGYTEADINKCLNFQSATGAGYVFDAALAASSGICTVLAKGTNCVRTIDRKKLSVSGCLLTAIAEGVPTHLVLGGILPICLTVGTDVTLLYPDLNIKFDPNGYKTQITINAFDIQLGNMWVENSLATWLPGNEITAFDASIYNTGAFFDYVGNGYSTSGNLSVVDNGINLGTSGILQYNNSGNLVDMSKSFTIECDYSQTSDTDFAEWQLVRFYATLTNRTILGFDRSVEKAFVVRNNTGDSGTTKVTRDLAPYAALKTTVPVHLKYVYDASTGTHTIYIDGTQVDTFVYVMKMSNSAAFTVTGGYGAGASAACTAIIDRYSIRQGVY